MNVEWKKKLALCAAALLVAGVATAQQGGEEAMSEEAAPAAESEATGATTDDEMGDVSYAIGLNIGRNLASQGSKFDADKLVSGLRDGLAGNEPAMTDEEMQAAMQAFQTRMMAEQQAQRQQEAEANARAGEQFLAENAEREGVVETESGLQYKVEEAGEGPPPGPADQVVVHYRGTLLDGTEFDSSYSRGEPATFPVGGVIPGFAEGLQKFGKGGKGTLWIPGDLAYGESGGPGGANSMLTFEIELVDVLRSGAEAAGGEGAEGGGDDGSEDGGSEDDAAGDDGGES